jgi:hypothetical protein
MSTSHYRRINSVTTVSCYLQHMVYMGVRVILYCELGSVILALKLSSYCQVRRIFPRTANRKRTTEMFTDPETAAIPFTSPIRELPRVCQNDLGQYVASENLSFGEY